MTILNNKPDSHTNIFLTPVIGAPHSGTENKVIILFRSLMTLLPNKDVYTAYLNKETFKK